jgi:hypothetical protein
MSQRSQKSSPKRKSRALPRKPGQPTGHSLLNDEIEKRICSFVARGHSFESSCLAVGINRTTLQNWRQRGMEDPSGRYGKFVEKLEAGRNRAKIRFVNFLANNVDWRARWKLMKNFWPGEFSERINSEISGVGGAPIPVEATINPYTVKVICSQPMPDFPILPTQEPTNGNGQRAGVEELSASEPGRV